MTEASHGWTAYRIEPLQPVVFRSGRPFGTGVGADGANLPLPGAAAGVLRTLHAQARAQGTVQYDTQALQTIAQKGPLLLRGSGLPATDEDLRQMCHVPRPADAVYAEAEDEGGLTARRLRPAPLPPGVGCDLPAGLLPVQVVDARKGKPRAGPLWWTLQQWLCWQMGEMLRFPDEQSSQWPLIQHTTHVKLDDETRAAQDGQLFQLQAWDFGPRIDGKPGWSFLSLSNADIEPRPDLRLAVFGGEGRLSLLHREPAWLDGLHRAVEPLLLRAQGARGVAVTLLTPAVFDGGWRPGWLGDDGVGTPPGTGPLRLALRAAAVERWQPLSGWDLALERPKPMRKGVPAGSVYWFDVVEGDVPQAVRALWLTAISDSAHDRAQGFGVGLAAPWWDDPTGHAGQRM